MNEVEKQQLVIDLLFKKYKDNGYISEEDILNTSIEYCLKFQQIDAVCNILLSMGILMNMQKSNLTEDIIDYSQVDYDCVFSKILVWCPSLANLVNHINKIPPPQKREVNNLLKQAHNGNTYAKNKVINMYLRVVLRIALTYKEKTTYPIEDIVSEGIIGLITAVNKFDETQHTYFISYASFWIKQVIDRALIDKERLIRIPVHFYGVVQAVENARNCTQATNIKLINEIVNSTEIEDDKVVLALNLLEPICSLEEYSSEYDMFQGHREVTDYYSIEELVEFDYFKSNLHEILRTLTEKERKVISLRYGLFDGIEHTLEEVGNYFEVTRERIRQIEAKCFRKLRNESYVQKIKANFF